MKVVGSMEVMRVIQREELFDRIVVELRARLADFEDKVGCPLGLNVVQVEAIETQNVKNPTEPARVREAFNMAQMAASYKDQLRREGEGEASKIVSAAEAEADSIRAEARAEQRRLVSAAEADAAAFAQILPIYRQSKAVGRVLRVMYYERVVEELMTTVANGFVMYASDGRELRLHHTPRVVERAESGNNQNE